MPLGGIVPRSIPRPSMGLGLVEIERTTSNEAECKNTPNQATQNTEDPVQLVLDVTIFEVPWCSGV